MIYSEVALAKVQSCWVNGAPVRITPAVDYAREFATSKRYIKAKTMNKILTYTGQHIYKLCCRPGKAHFLVHEPDAMSSSVDNLKWSYKVYKMQLRLAIKTKEVAIHNKMTRRAFREYEKSCLRKV